MSESSNKDKLNFFSESFDALEALYSDAVAVPWKKAPVFDNISRYESAANASDGKDSLDKVLKNQNKIRTAKKAKKLARSDLGKLPEPIASTSTQELDEDWGDIPQIEDNEEKQVKSKKKERKTFDNVLTLIEKAEGPLAFLKNCMHHRVRLKVLTRRRASIRGYCLGFVLAFDKHWNIVLEDVTEIWTRKTKRKTVPLGFPSEPPEEWKIKGPPYFPPTVHIIKRGGGKETCQRHVKQLLLRGEHVVLISVASPTQN